MSQCVFENNVLKKIKALKEKKNPCLHEWWLG